MGHHGDHSVDREAEYIERMQRRQCPICGVTMIGLTPRGRCLYAAPCGHRIGRGNAAAWMQWWSANQA